MLRPAGDRTPDAGIRQTPVSTVDRPTPHVRVRGFDVDRALGLTAQAPSAPGEGVLVAGGGHWTVAASLSAIQSSSRGVNLYAKLLTPWVASSTVIRVALGASSAIRRA